MNICDYGCGQEAKYQFKNGKWCCSKNTCQCSAMIERKIKTITSKTWEDIYGVEEAKIRKKERSELFKIKNPMKGKKHTKETINKIKSTKAKQNCSEITKQSYTIELKQKRKQAALKLWKDDNFREKNTNSIKKSWKKQSVINKHKRTIAKINKKYPFFSKIEEIRYNPNKPKEKEIQVRCKNHNCPNSKEKGGWFTPISRQIEWRIDALENNGKDLNYFYCSNDCKDSCPLYDSKGTDPFKETNIPYIQGEYNIWKQIVLKQDDYECQRCGSKENLHCHHIIPVKIEPMFSLDPDNGIVLCKKCHYKYGHRDECSTGYLANKLCKKTKQIIAAEV